jgi:carboxyl-terminal processing protease
LDSEPYVLTDPISPVAVLIRDLTTSAGEGVLVAFIGRPATRSFGTPTAGLPTSPRRFLLPDGAYLVFTDAAATDRNGQVYESEISPDERVIDLFPDDENDIVLDAAIAWLDEQEPCSRS